MISKIAFTNLEQINFLIWVNWLNQDLDVISLNANRLWDSPAFNPSDDWEVMREAETNNCFDILQKSFESLEILSILRVYYQARKEIIITKPITELWAAVLGSSLGKLWETLKSKRGPGQWQHIRSLLSVWSLLGGRAGVQVGKCFLCSFPSQVVGTRPELEII